MSEKDIMGALIYDSTHCIKVKLAQKAVMAARLKSLIAWGVFYIMVFPLVVAPLLPAAILEWFWPKLVGSLIVLILSWTAAMILGRIADMLEVRKLELEAELVELLTPQERSILSDMEKTRSEFWTPIVVIAVVVAVLLFMLKYGRQVPDM